MLFTRSRASSMSNSIGSSTSSPHLQCDNPNNKIGGELEENEEDAENIPNPRNHHHNFTSNSNSSKTHLISNGRTTMKNENCSTMIPNNTKSSSASSSSSLDFDSCTTTVPLLQRHHHSSSSLVDSASKSNPTNTNHTNNSCSSPIIQRLGLPIATSTPTQLTVTIFEEEAELRHAPWFQAGIPRYIYLFTYLRLCISWIP